MLRISEHTASTASLVLFQRINDVTRGHSLVAEGLSASLLAVNHLRLYRRSKPVCHHVIDQLTCDNVLHCPTHGAQHQSRCCRGGKLKGWPLYPA